MSEPVLELLGVTKQVGTPPRTLFQDLSAAILPGETVAVRGRSGSGKSTLLNIVGGLDLAFSGQVRMAGRSIAELSDDDRAALRVTTVTMVFQAFHLVEHLSLLRNVTLPARFNSTDTHADVIARARELLGAVGLAERADDLPRSLSGGERQRVAIARALLLRPKLLLADEPTGNLDQETAQRVLDVFSSLTRSNGTAVLLVTHDPSVASRADRVLRLVEGSLQPWREGT